MPDPLVIVCGVDRDAVHVAHDLRRLGEGVVTRAVRRDGRWSVSDPCDELEGPVVVDRRHGRNR